MSLYPGINRVISSVLKPSAHATFVNQRQFFFGSGENTASQFLHRRTHLPPTADACLNPFSEQDLFFWAFYSKSGSF